MGMWRCIREAWGSGRDGPGGRWDRPGEVEVVAGSQRLAGSRNLERARRGRAGDELVG